MSNKKLPDLGAKERFLKVYANLPLALRSDIIYVLDKYDGLQGKQAMTWNACWLEINNNTEISKKILKGLDELDFI